MTTKPLAITQVLEVQNPEVRLTVYLVLEVQNPEVRLTVHLVLPTALFHQESLQALVRTHLTVHQKVLVPIRPVVLNLKLRTVYLEALRILNLIPPVDLVSLPLDPQVVLHSHLEVEHKVHLMVLLMILLEVLLVLAPFLNLTKFGLRIRGERACALSPLCNFPTGPFQGHNSNQLRVENTSFLVNA